MRGGCHLLSLAMAYGFIDLLARRNFSRKMAGALPFCGGEEDQNFDWGGAGGASALRERAPAS